MTAHHHTQNSETPSRYYRNGPSHGDHNAIDFVQVRRRFDFCSIEIGRWVTRPERERAAGLFFDALCDLMLILQGTEEVISLRGSLSLQYGIGGRPGVAAHYNPGTRSFSLAKNAGPGSIAHEWFHAFDHYIASKTVLNADSRVFASYAWLNNAPLIQHPLNTLLFDCFHAIMLDDTGTQPSALFNASAAADSQLTTLYYSLPEELCARAFEAFVQDAAIKNNFLVAGTQATKEAELGLYPQGAQRLKINAAFSRYFRTLGVALTRQG
ncbi:MAG: CLCA_X family protein [Oceanisphaera sp.]